MEAIQPRRRTAFQKLGDEALKELTYALHDSVYVFECFSARDALQLVQAEAELLRRGYKIEDVTSFRIV